MTDAYDAVVVGGGIVGASTAYHLARQGQETLLLDRDDAGRATDAGAGILSPATTSRAVSDEWFAFATDAFAYYPELVDRLEREGDVPTSFDRPGLLSVAVSADERESFEETLERIDARRQRTGTPAPGSVEEVDDATARSAFPPLAPTDRAFHYADAARVDGRVFTDALLSAGRSHGLSVESGDVTRLATEDGSVTGVRTATGRTVDADSVVVAGGAWSSAFADQLGVEIPVEPMRGQIAHLDVDAATGEWPIVGAFRGHYLVPWDDGRVAVGATRESRSGFDPRRTAAGVREVLDEALRVAPGLADATLREIRVGLRPASADGHPVLGAIPGVSGAYLATGHGPTGLQLGPYSGKLVADLAAGRDVGEALDPFSVSRFGSDR